MNFLFPLPGCFLKIKLPRAEFVFLCAHHESHHDPPSLVALAAGVLRDRSVAIPGGVQNLTAHSRRELHVTYAKPATLQLPLKRKA